LPAKARFIFRPTEEKEEMEETGALVKMQRRIRERMVMQAAVVEMEAMVALVPTFTFIIPQVVPLTSLKLKLKISEGKLETTEKAGEVEMMIIKQAPEYNMLSTIEVQTEKPEEAADRDKVDYYNSF
jgi:hypothetical protein